MDTDAQGALFLLVAVPLAVGILFLKESLQERWRARRGDPRGRLLYGYAHQLVPSFVHGQPALIHGALDGAADPDALDGPLQSAWTGGCLQAGLDPEPRPKVTVEPVGALRALLVTMPTAGGMALAHFIGVIPVGPGFRCFVLEAGIGGTVLGEWTADRRHVNLGSGPPPQREVFLAALAAILA
jgi:hypothetical protein